MSKTVNQKYGQGTSKISATIRPETLAGLQELRRLFSTKYKGPSHSAILESVLSAHLEYLNSSPDILAGEIEDWRQRYGA